jgi:hypothetical protein
MDKSPTNINTQHRLVINIKTFSKVFFSLLKHFCAKPVTLMQTNDDQDDDDATN